MSPFDSPWRRRTWRVLIAASLAFNAGIGATVGVEIWRAQQDARAPAIPSPLGAIENASDTVELEKGPRGGRGARDGAGEHRRPRESPLSRLNLSPDQRVQFESLRCEMQERSAELRSALRRESDLLLDLLAAPAPDAAAIDAASAQLSDLRSRLQQEMLRHVREVQLILTPEQQPEYLALVRHMLTRGDGLDRRRGPEHDSRGGEPRGRSADRGARRPEPGGPGTRPDRPD